MKTNAAAAFITEFTDSTDGNHVACYPYHPRYPWLNILVFLSGMVLFPARAQVQQAWVSRYNNGILNGTNQAGKMALDSAGNIYTTGYSQNTNGNLGYATIKYGANGTEVWAARFDSTNYPSATPASMVLDPSNNVIVTGSGVTIKYSTNGTQLWTAPYSATALAVDAGGSVYVTGFGTNFNTEKLSADGSNVWGTTYKDVGPTLSQVILVDNASNVYISGLDTYSYSTYESAPGKYASEPCVLLTTMKYDGNGNQQWGHSQELTGAESDVQIGGAALDSSNDLYLVSDWPTGGPGYFADKYSSNGVLVSTAYVADNYWPSIAHGLALDVSDTVYLTGQVMYQYNGAFSYNCGTYKLEANFDVAWASSFPDPLYGSSVATAITDDKANNVYVTGYSLGTNSYNDIVTIKYDNNGNQIWVQSYSSPGGGDAAANAIAVDGYGNVYVAGYDTTPAGGTEMVLIKYAPTLSGSPQTNGAFLLQTTGEPGETIDVQSSTNLSIWQDLGSITADTNGNLQFLDTNAALYPARFYFTKPQ